MAEVKPFELADKGILGRTDEMLGNDWTQQVVRVFNDIADEIKKGLSNVRLSENRGLLQSIFVTKDETGTGYSFKLHMAEYGTYLDEGVRGNKSSHAGIRHNRPGFQRGNKPPSSAFDRYEEDKWKVRANVFNYGIRPRNFYSNVVNDQTLERVNEEIAEITKGQILASIRASF